MQGNQVLPFIFLSFLLLLSTYWAPAMFIDRGCGISEENSRHRGAAGGQEERPHKGHTLVVELNYPGKKATWDCMKLKNKTWKDQTELHID